MRKLNNENVNKVVIAISILLVIVVILIIVLFFWKNVFYKKDKIDTMPEANVPEKTHRVERENTTKTSNTTNTSSQMNGDLLSSIGSVSGSSTSKKKEYMDGYAIIGKIKISKINLSYNILEKATTHSLELSVAMVSGPGLNQVGNTVIMGHNYRNGEFFSDVYKLSNGDTIEIEDLDGKTVKYEIYNIYETTVEDTEYAWRDTNGAREISLTSCNDDVDGRIIVLAREK